MCPITDVYLNFPASINKCKRSIETMAVGVQEGLVDILNEVSKILVFSRLFVFHAWFVFSGVRWFV